MPRLKTFHCNPDLQCILGVVRREVTLKFQEIVSLEVSINLGVDHLRGVSFTGVPISKTSELKGMYERYPHVESADNHSAGLFPLGDPSGHYEFTF